MNTQQESIATSYLPVAWEYREVIEEQIKKKAVGKVFFFGENQSICEGNGTILQMIEIQKEGIFIILENEFRIRIDRIITLFGKPGAAYDEYDAFANACMSCTGGYEKKDLIGYSMI